MEDPVEIFQKRHGLTPDGIVGKNTACEIKNTYCQGDVEYAAHFIGQCSHESFNFSRTEENLNYSYKRLLEIFRYDVDQNKDRKLSKEEKDFAKSLIGSPEKIANFVYANQNGNGDMLSGDGWKYRGRGALQLTGRSNYEIFANKIGDLSIMENPDLVATKYFFETAKVFFDVNNVWRFCDEVDEEYIRKVTRAINGGLNGINDRINKTYHYYNVLL